LICLKIINFSWNKIKVLHPLTFICLDSLQVIDFNFNQIKKFHPSIIVIRCRYVNSKTTFMC
jgi:hypothetical protein